MIRLHNNLGDVVCFLVESEYLPFTFQRPRSSGKERKLHPHRGDK